jgi:hypothetical protein
MVDGAGRVQSSPGFFSPRLGRRFPRQRRHFFTAKSIRRRNHFAGPTKRSRNKGRLSDVPSSKSDKGASND